MDKNLSLEPGPRNRKRDAGRADGTGAVVAVVAVAALIIFGLLYVLQPLGDSPARVTSEAPSAIMPAPSK